jgi:hypothetical protein
MLGTTLGATNKNSQFQVMRSEFGPKNSFMLQKTFENWIKKFTSLQLLEWNLIFSTLA